MKVYVDFDDVICETARDLSALAERLYAIRVPYPAIRAFDLHDAFGLDDVTVYKRANIDRKVFSSIRCKPHYRPKKRTAVAFAIALQLDMEDARDLLARAELAFSPSSRFDLIVTYFITNRIYDIYALNAALFKYGEPTLGE